MCECVCVLRVCVYSVLLLHFSFHFNSFISRIIKSDIQIFVLQATHDEEEKQ